jgi:hypothetical protein
LDKVVACSRSDNLSKVIMEAVMITLLWNQIVQMLIYFWGLMVLMFFKAQGLVSQTKSMTHMFLIIWGFVVWLVKQTWKWNLAFGDPPWTFVTKLVQLFCTFTQKAFRVHKVG